jgi:hypothetical protein
MNRQPHQNPYLPSDNQSFSSSQQQGWLPPPRRKISGSAQGEMWRPRRSPRRFCRTGAIAIQSRRHVPVLFVTYYRNKEGPVIVHSPPPCPVPQTHHATTNTRPHTPHTATPYTPPPSTRIRLLSRLNSITNIRARSFLRVRVRVVGQEEQVAESVIRIWILCFPWFGSR